MPGGRPTDYTEEIAIEICSRIASGQSIAKISKENDMPCQAAIYNWLAKYPEFVERYTKARESQADMFAEEILQIADESTNDWMLSNDPDNIGYKLNGEAIQRSKLRIDTRKWLAGKLRPKKYGDSINQKVTDGDGNPLPVANTDIAERMIALLEKSKATVSVVTDGDKISE